MYCKNCKYSKCSQNFWLRCTKDGCFYNMEELSISEYHDINCDDYEEVVMKNNCIWKIQDGSYRNEYTTKYTTECGQTYGCWGDVFDEELDFKYCPYCGKKVSFYSLFGSMT